MWLPLHQRHAVPQQTVPNAEMVENADIMQTPAATIVGVRRRTQEFSVKRVSYEGIVRCLPCIHVKAVGMALVVGRIGC